MRLIREIRCYPDDGHEAVPNTWAGTGSGTILGAYRVLRAVVEGPVDRRTGYLCDIKDIDRILRTVVATGLQTRGEGTGSGSPSLAAALVNAFPHAARGLRPAALRSLELHASPHTRLAVDERGAGMIRLTQSFEFSAAHRLFCKGGIHLTQVTTTCSVHGHGRPNGTQGRNRLSPYVPGVCGMVWG